MLCGVTGNIRHFECRDREGYLGSSPSRAIYDLSVNWQIKRRLIAEKELNEECSKCGIGPTWNGEKLVLVLDHINGIYNDNRKENLRLLCPNCNSQTDTFAGKNIQYAERKVLGSGRMVKAAGLGPATIEGSSPSSPVLLVKNVYTCLQCGIEICRGGKNGLCLACFSKSRRKVEHPSKEELDQLMKEQSMCAIGRIYNVSDNAIRKWAKSYGLL